MTDFISGICVYLYQNDVCNSAANIDFTSTNLAFATDQKSGYLKLINKNLELIDWIVEAALMKDPQRFGFEKNDVDNDLILNLNKGEFDAILNSLSDEEIYQHAKDINGDNFQIYEIPMSKIPGCEIFENMIQTRVEEITFKLCVDNLNAPISMIKDDPELQKYILEQRF